MKIFTTDIKTVKELTKYISPANIEKARFKKYNTPIINDGNLLCDEFFRTQELFDSNNDIVESFYPNSIDDIPAIDRKSLSACHRRQLEGSNTAYIQSDLPYYVDIIGTKKRIYLESYGTKSPKYPDATADYNYQEVWKSYQKLYQNCSVDDIANIKYYAKKLSTYNSQEIELEAVSMLHEGYPLEAIINIMKESTIKLSDRETCCSKGLMRFFIQYPKLKRYMITYDNNKNETFDSNGAKMFTELLEICNEDDKLAYRILWDCRKEMQDGSFMTNPDLLRLGEFLYEIDKNWTPEKAKIVQLVGLKDLSNYRTNVSNVQKLLYNGYSIKDVIDKLTKSLPQKTRKDIEML